MKNNKYGFISTDGEFYIDPIYDYSYSFLDKDTTVVIFKHECYYLTRQKELIKSEKCVEYVRQLNSDYHFIDTMPHFQGGDDDIKEYIDNHIVYPTILKKTIEGTVFVKLIVKHDGSVSKVWVNKSLNPILDEAAKRVVENMPTWTPAFINGVPIEMISTVSIDFYYGKQPLTH